MPFERDPLSVRYDPTVRQVMLRAIRASRDRRGVQAWVASSRYELAHKDAGGRTAHERAFTRAAYYLVWRVPLNMARIPDWSLRVQWGTDAELRPSSSGRMARPVRLRIWPRATGRRYAYDLPAGKQWARNEELRSGGIGSGRERF